MTHPDPDPDLTDPSAAPKASAHVPYDWDRAREDFLAGEPAVIVAARIGVSERTFSRRASEQGWRRADDRRRFVTEAPLDPTLSARAPLDMLMLTAEVEDKELLEDGDPRRAIRYAHRRANEAVVRRRPAEALAWVRLIEVLDRVGVAIRIACALPSEADALRAIRREAEVARSAAQAEEMERLLKAMPDDPGDDD